MNNRNQKKNVKKQNNLKILLLNIKKKIIQKILY